ncbi:porin [Dyella subtropica]|uniref:porin n=1 Tax=Dyella subtropica TaxID=2992127 RepID=UPI0022500FDE|nr:porin [Dyella subtropica]
MKKTAFALAVASAAFVHPVHASEAELKAMILQLQQKLEAQAAQLQTQAAEIKDLRTQTQTLVGQQAKTANAMAAVASPAPTTPSPSNSTAVTTTPPPVATASDTSFGGYGEIAYNHYTKDSSRSQADLKRFVILFGHRFTDQLSFNSEVEWEHAVTSANDQGESEIEQAYLNYQFNSAVNLKAGLFLMPFGLLNQSHEPPAFYGVERNEVETRIIPSTWREGGLGLYGSTDAGLKWDVGVTTGFDTAKLDDASSPLHASHQELQLAKAHDLAAYAAVNYQGIPGWTVGGAVFSGNSMHANADFKTDNTKPNFAGISARVTLWDVHTRWQQNGWDLSAVYAKGTIGDAGKIDTTVQAFNTATGANRPYVPSAFYGWLVQGAYTVWEHGDMKLTPFVRYEKFNTQSKMPAGFLADAANADRVTTVGVSFNPHPQVVCKADYQKFQDHPKNDRFNLGIGYMF